MFRTFSLSLAVLADRAILRVLVRSVLIALSVFTGLGLLIDRLLVGTDPCGLIGLASGVPGSGGSALSAMLLTLAGIRLLFPAVAIGIASLFSDRIVTTVEARHYPQALATARHPGQLEIAGLGLRSVLRLPIYNLVALPFYLILLVTGVGPLILFLLVNAVALGRGLWNLVAVRHLAPAARRDLLAATRSERFVPGLAVTLLFMIPVANLAAPVSGGAMAAHLFHGRFR